MTLKLVAPEVPELPVRNLMDIPAMARGFADDLEANDYGEVTRAVVIVDTPDGLHILGWGENVTTFEAIGILECAKMTSYGSMFDDD